MSDDSLLTSVFKYPPRKKHSPEENFTTEAFAWLLRNDKEAEKTFLKCLNQNTDEEWVWKTQFTLDNEKRPDLVALSTSSTLIIEIKVDSELHETQLDSYKEGSKNLGNSSVILLTRNKSQHSQNADFYLTWNDIYFALQDIDQKSWKVEEFIQFLNFLVNPVKNKDFHWFLLSYYAELFKMIDKMSTIFKEVVNQIYKDKPTGVVKEVKHDYRWGRNSIAWNYPVDTWEPGVTIGLIEKPDDHDFNWITNSNGTPFGLLISVNCHKIDTHKLVETEIWKNFIAEIKNHFGNNEWNIYNAFDDASKHGVKNPNKWHPLFIWKPFSDIISATFEKSNNDNTFEDTLVQTIMHLSIEMYTTLTKMDSYKILEDALKIGNY